MDLKTLVANLRRDADELETLDRLLSGFGGLKSPANVRKGSGRTLSAAARARISAAQKARWAKKRAGKK